MKKTLIILSALVLMLSLVTVAGCGGGEEAAETETAAEAETAVDAVVATHDCDGGCGMTNMTAEQTTEIDGKFYCAGCAKHMQEGSHEGHNH